MPPTRPGSRSTRSGADDDRGAGLISTLIGVAVFLVLLLFAAQLLLNLYATSVVSAATFDAARIVAGSDGGAAEVPRAEAHARDLLGRFGEDVRFEWAIDDRFVDVHVTAENANPLLPGMAGRIAFDHIDRHVKVRVERFR